MTIVTPPNAMVLDFKKLFTSDSLDFLRVGKPSIEKMSRGQTAVQADTHTPAKGQFNITKVIEHPCVYKPCNRTV